MFRARQSRAVALAIRRCEVRIEVHYRNIHGIAYRKSFTCLRDRRSNWTHDKPRLLSTNHNPDPTEPADNFCWCFRKREGILELLEYDRRVAFQMVRINES